MKNLILLIGLFLASCTFQVETLGDSNMNGNPFDPMDPTVAPFNPPPQGGFDPARDYGQPSNRQLDKPLKAWQANARVTSSNTKVGPIVSLMSISFPEPGIYTAQFSIAQPSRIPNGNPVATATSVLRCQAILNWTVEGNQVQRIFDIGNGTTISGAGSGAILQVQDLTVTLPGATGANGVDYQVSVSITRGTRAQFRVPVIQPGAATFVSPAGPIAAPQPIGAVIVGPGGIADYAVPSNAGVIGAKVSVVDAALLAGSLRTPYVSAIQLNGGVGYYNWIPDADPDFVPLIPGVQTIRVSNLSGSENVLVGLDWAIDG